MIRTGERAERVISGEPGVFELGPGDPWVYPFEVEGRVFLRVVVEQIGTDLSVVLLAADGAELFTTDSPIGANGEEELVAVLDPGSYWVEIRPNEDSPAGKFHFRGVTLEPAGTSAEAHVRADRDHRRGWQLFIKERAFEAALEKYRQALGAWKTLGLARQQADTLDCMAQAYLKKKQPEVAAGLMEQAIELGRTLSSRHDRMRLVVHLDRAGIIQRGYSRQPARAIRDYFDEALAIAHDLEDQPWLVSLIHHHRGKARQSLGELQPALDDFEVALEAILGEELSRRRVLIHKDMAAALLRLGSSQEAYEEAERANSLALQIEMDEFADQAKVLMARARAQQGDLASALALVTEAVDGMRRRNDDRALLEALQALGDCHRKAGDLDAARVAFEEALDLSKKERRPLAAATMRLELGYLATMEGDASRGLELMNQALAQFRALKTRPHEASALARSAEALQEMGRLEEARHRIEAALALVEGLRAATVREDRRLGFFAFRQEYFEIALDLSVEGWRRDPGPVTAERALALHDRRLALELRSRWQRRQGEGGGASEDRARRERQLEAELAVVARSAKTGETERSAEIDRLLRRLAAVRGEERRGREKEEEVTSGVDLESLRREHLDPGTLVAVWALGSRESYLWTLDRDSAPTLSILPLTREAMSRTVTAWTKLLAESRPRDHEERRRLGRELSDGLLFPLRDRLGGRRLVIVADSALLGLPFAALPDPREPSKYLVESTEVVYLPSLAQLPILRRAELEVPHSRRPAAAFVDPVFSSEDDRLEGAVPDSGPSSLQRGAMEWESARGMDRAGGGLLLRLPASLLEGRRLLEVVKAEGSRLYSGFDASLDTLRGENLNRFGILHFGTHALVDPLRPDLSRLVLSTFDELGRAQEGSLFGFEIAGMNLSTDLVVLSACQTARGQWLPGEGVLGLSRRFFDAGAARVLATHWSVGDRSTALLMTDFYEGLLEGGLAPGEALRQAQLARLAAAKTSDPYFWAAFRLEGDWRRPKGW